MSTKVLLLLFFLLIFIAPQNMRGQVCDPPMPQDTKKHLLRDFQSLLLLREAQLGCMSQKA
jgi:hypothetical protein